MFMRWYHHHLKLRALLGGGGSCGGIGSFPKPIAPLPGSPPLTPFLKHLLGNPAALSRVPVAEPCSLTLHFLRNSCVLSEDAAATVATRVRLRSTKKAHAVLALLRSLGVVGADLARVVATAPNVLSYRVEETLAPKIDFFRREVGLSDTAIRRALIANPYRFLCYSLEGCLRPNYLILRDLLGSDKNVTSAVLQSTELIHGNVRGILLPRVKTLRDLGASDAVIVKLITRHPQALMHRASLFEESLAGVKELGVTPSSGMFPYSFGLFARLRHRRWKCKMENFLSLGWTEEQVKQAFVRHPYCMSASNDKVKRIWQLCSEKLGWSPEYVSGTPMVLSLSYEKRLLPRYTVLKLLASRGVFKGDIKVGHLILGEKRFVERYVTRYQEEIPEVLEAYTAGRASAVAA